MSENTASETEACTLHAGTKDHSRADSWCHIAAFPARSFPGLNPYIDKLYETLRFSGISHEPLALDDRWLRANAERIDAVHFHWPERFWPRSRGIFPRLHAVIGFLRFVRKAKRLRIRVLWTIHELFPHNADWLDVWAYRQLSRYSDLLIFHSMWAFRQGKVAYRPRGNTVVMPHPAYLGIYPKPGPRDATLEWLGLNPNLPMVCCFGHIRHDKGFDLAARAFAAMGGRVQLVIAGPPSSDGSADQLTRLTTGHAGIAVLARKVTEQELASIVAASEAVIFPYRVITTSGALLTALSLGRGAICSRLPFFEEVLAEEQGAGALFDAGSAEALAATIDTYLRLSPSLRQSAALRIASRRTWQNCAIPVVDALAAFAGDHIHHTDSHV